MSAETKDYYCTGSCMTYCSDCKWKARWDVVGESTRAERNEKWPGLISIPTSTCQLTSGMFFKAEKEPM
jgi:hypothetical protein